MEAGMATETMTHRQTQPWRRVASIALIVAGVLILTSALFPTPDDPADHASFLALLVENSGRTRIVLLTVPVGIWALAIGIAALRRTSGQDLASFRLGSYAVLGGATAVTVQFALSNAALAQAIDGAFDTGLTLWIGATYLRMYSMLLLWAGIAAVGRGMLASRTYPNWVGWPALLLGVAMVLVSGATVAGGPTQAIAVVPGALAALTAVWSVILGVWLARHPITTRT
jgi:hypothetical protein